ncbi:(4Fe-4S)-binding protein [Tenacibaculum sp. S7007]|uniref:(4Fe-4S)-binding protein n=1 Tax=Tenacibaculum pelagium TaxID=2759527 RepID=A0A839AJW2_9FLAO|nr:(4Fe-4S)-binding protein [Tenacibaculum pelagium]MBA6155345.1 (4Fe-4S)-binding protein [Tenacibaculum pelagium]
MAEKREIVKEYSNDDITVVWKPNTCIHAKKCWKELLQVFNPQNRPWVNMEGATTARIKKQVEACPSGALSYISKGESQETMHTETKVEALENGPLLVYGTLHITNSDGITEKKNKTTAFCRCGASQNKPYCDGAHVKAEFKG